ncbi:MAG: DNA alkylation repair protein [Anaerolineae bacterium]|nr:DNA alkylation repair protein [Anaerolineae bacterium]
MSEIDAQVAVILRELEAQGKPANVEGMARFGIRPGTTVYGIPIPTLRQMARRIGRDHGLAKALWNSGVHEARLIAAFIAEPKRLTEAEADEWVEGIDSWDVCDQSCSSFLWKTPFAYAKAVEWSGREEEFVRRAGFVMMAALAVHDKKAPDERFEPLLEVITRGADDERNFVKKAVNWALRQIGKRSHHLNGLAVQTAERIQQMDSKAARWVAADALRELTSEKTRGRIKR